MFVRYADYGETPTQFVTEMAKAFGDGFERVPQAPSSTLQVPELRPWPPAYRPFEGTDAAVTDPGELEIELQPAGMLRQGSQTILHSRPSAVRIPIFAVAGACRRNRA